LAYTRDKNPSALGLHFGAGVEHEARHGGAVRLRLEQRAQARDVDGRVGVARDDQQIAGLESQRERVGKHLQHRRDRRLHRRGLDLVGLQPLRENAALGQALARRPIEVERVEARDARAVRVRWL
jgi:hypothetical protein